MSVDGQPDVAYLATDVGLWMSLPAFGPALFVVAAVVYIVRRDRRNDAEELTADGGFDGADGRTD